MTFGYAANKQFGKSTADGIFHQAKFQRQTLVRAEISQLNF